MQINVTLNKVFGKMPQQMCSIIKVKGFGKPRSKEILVCATFFWTGSVYD